MQRDAFVGRVGHAPFLFVQSPPSNEPLRQALATTVARSGRTVPPSPDGLPFFTASSHFTPTSQRSRGSELTGTLFAVVLHKRAGSNTMSEHRICVGRAHGNDVVLRDPSVSKLHAWFERDEDGSYFVHDAGSRNGTMIGPERGAPRIPRPVHTGSVVRFGSVVATFLSAEDTYALLTGATTR
jgi:hypothetical protein